jgi:DUF4097 and DUF4098 domain-containing protein YvlB
VAGVELRATVPVPNGTTPEIRIGTASGKVTISTWDRQSIEVSASRPPRQRFELATSGLLDLSHAFGASAILEIRCPAGTNATIGTASGRVIANGELGRLSVTSVSGNIALQRARVAELRTVSGRIEAESVTDLARVATRSGNVVIGDVAIAEISTASGRVAAGPATGDLRAQSVSGRLELQTNGRANVAARTVSGSITVQLPLGTQPRLAIRTRSPVDFAGVQGEDCTCQLQSVSGRVEVRLQ